MTRRVCLLALLGLLLVGGCGASRRTEPTRTNETSAASSTIPPDLKVALAAVNATTALGDSVPYGSACACAPYPELTGADIARVAAHQVDASNDAVPGYTSGDVVSQLQHDADVITRVQGANAVMVEVGANDIAHSSKCGTDLACYEPKLPDITNNINAIVARIHALTHDHRVAIVLLDYWSVWLGGTYAHAQGPTYVATADKLTAQVSEIISTIAHTTKSTYVDLRTAFRGPNDAWDETHLLAPDGDHPNAAGHERIADAVAQAVAQAATP